MQTVTPWLSLPDCHYAVTLSLFYNMNLYYEDSNVGPKGVHLIQVSLHINRPDVPSFLLLFPSFSFRLYYFWTGSLCYSTLDTEIKDKNPLDK